MTPQIIDLQYFQELHDQHYHKDVYGLPLMRRLGHLHNHLVKYDANDLKRNASYADALACILSMANALNLDITRGFEKHQSTLVMFMPDIKPKYHLSVLKTRYTEELGNMAKLLEGSDHNEPLQYKLDFGKCIIECLMVLAQIRQDIDDLSIESWVQEYVSTIFHLKTKNIFHAQIHDMNLSVPPYRSIVAWNNI
ncbi:hypothetical protein Acj9p017 [Acinetobacter phage Acj9]|uniref:Uncharacterized protein n=1 Tax=Acinetobacter phage Acj9 TaxID=760939 RepID=E5EPF1_9CAUD|nr:hypothetical protein Acj9p017 [Acinetobacter phage Acj9]ADG59917.1 conserved hypothetical protein [Acinetobacter phage Acj9]